jgi:hypothetical protein
MPCAEGKHGTLTPLKPGASRAAQVRFWIAASPKAGAGHAARGASSYASSRFACKPPSAEHSERRLGARLFVHQNANSLPFRAAWARARHRGEIGPGRILIHRGPAMATLGHAADRASGGTRHKAFRAVRTHARHGPRQLRGDLDRFTFVLGGRDGERLFGPGLASRAGRPPVPGVRAATAPRTSSSAAGSAQHLDGLAYPFAALCGRR